MIEFISKYPTKDIDIISSFHLWKVFLNLYLQELICNKTTNLLFYLDIAHKLQVAYSTYCCSSGHPSEYWTCSLLLNFDLEETGAFSITLQLFYIEFPKLVESSDIHWRSSSSTFPKYSSTFLSIKTDFSSAIA